MNSHLWGQEAVLRPGLTGEVWVERVTGDRDGLALRLAGMDDSGRPFEVGLGKDDDDSLARLLTMIDRLTGTLGALTREPQEPKP